LSPLPAPNDLEMVEWEVMANEWMDLVIERLTQIFVYLSLV
jgi:hypothetical protein